MAGEATNVNEASMEGPEEKQSDMMKEREEKQREAWERIYKESGENLELSGGWFVLTGTIITALGETKDFVWDTESGKPGVVAGNAVEAFGNSLQAIGIAKVFEVEGLPGYLTSSVGCWLQAIGNAGNSVATQIEIQGEEEEGESLNALSSGVQALGAYLEAAGNASLPPFIMQNVLITGNSLIALGSALDAIGQIFLLQEQEEAGEIIILIGAWLQVVGAAYEVYALSIRNSYSAFEERQKETEENRYSYAAYGGRR